MTKTQQLNDLFSTWRRHRPSHTTFVEDGIVNESLWHTAPRQVLFVLKDFYGYTSIDARQVFDGVTGTLPWRSLGRWAFGLQHSLKTQACAFHVADQSSNYTLGCRSMAVVNLKKTCGGASIKAATLRQFAQQDADFIRQEIEIIAPEVIVCGGTLSEFKTYIFPRLMPAKSFPHCCFFLPGLTPPRGGSTLVIGHYHPAYWRLGAQRPFNELMDKLLQNLPFTEGVQRDERTSQIGRETDRETSEWAGAATLRQKFLTELQEKAKTRTELFANAFIGRCCMKILANNLFPALLHVMPQGDNSRA